MPLSSIYVINENILKCFYPLIKIKQLPREGDVIEVFYKKDMIVYKVLGVHGRGHRCPSIFLSDNLKEENYRHTVNKFRESIKNYID